MSATIPEDARDLLDRPIVVTLVTLMEDNQPQATPIWIDYDGSHILVNSARGRAKDRNMEARPQVTVLSIDPENPYRYLEVRGVVDEITEEGATEHISKMAKKYFGRDDYYANNPEQKAKETRVLYKIKPQRVIYH
ncbi:MAG: PPOX class F420-dependent oxidoreductase [Aggregatilineales bacterium]